MLVVFCYVDWRYSVVHKTCYHLKSKSMAAIDNIASLKYVHIKQPLDDGWGTAHHSWKRSEFSKIQKDQIRQLARKINWSLIQYTKKHAKSDFTANKNDEFKQPKKIMTIAIKHQNFVQCNCKPGSIGLIIDNSICFDKSLVSEHFNNYFSNVAPTLVPPSNGKYERQHFSQGFYTSLSVTSSSFCFSEVSENNVLSILCKQCSSKATGLDL